jgi:hypothetical protein
MNGEDKNTAAVVQGHIPNQLQFASNHFVDVFISHAAEDSEEARKIAYALRARGLSTWMDVENIQPGQEWADEIEKVIRTSRVIVPIIGSSTKPRGRISREWSSILEHAWENPDLPILPVILDDVDPPNFLRDRRYIKSGRSGAELEYAADTIVCFMLSPDSIVERLSFKPSDINERQERFRILRQVLEEMKELE